MAKKAQPKLDLKSKSVPQKIQFARQIVTDVTAAPAFASLAASLPTITTAAADLEKSYNDAKVASDIAKAKTAIMNDKETALNLQLTNIGHSVEIIAKGDATIIKAAGFEVRGEAVATALKTDTKPTALYATVGDSDGEIDLHWDSVKGARSYEVQMCADPLTAAGWVHALNCTKSQCSITKLKSMSKTWFRVSAVLASDQGPWSDPVAKVAQ